MVVAHLSPSLLRSYPGLERVATVVERQGQQEPLESFLLAQADGDQEVVELEAVEAWAAENLVRLGKRLVEQGRYAQAQPILVQAIETAEASPELAGQARLVQVRMLAATGCAQEAIELARSLVEEEPSEQLVAEAVLELAQLTSVGADDLERAHQTFSLRPGGCGLDRFIAGGKG